MKFNRLLYILPIFSIVACQPEIDDIDFNGGSADFSRTVAVGNSLTAGFQSNALSLEGQMNSLPSIIAGQLKLVGGGEFTQPLLSGEAGAKGAGVEASLIVNNLLLPELSLAPSKDCLGETSLSPQILSAPYPITSFLELDASLRPFNNIGVPGAKIGNVTMPGYGSSQGNPFFARFAETPMETMLQAAMKTNATFFQLWIGNNDVLGYATTGGNEGGDAVTPVNTFSSAFKEILDSLAKNGAKGVVANIPDVTSIPFFTTIPTGVELTQEQADQLNSPMAYGAYNGGLDAMVANQALSQDEADERKIIFKAGLNPFVVLDPSLTDLTGFNPALLSMRQIKVGELLTLRTPSDSLKCARWGSAKPIPGNFHLTNAELVTIKNAVSGYNDIIKQEAQARQLAFVDVNARLDELATVGIKVSGINFTSELVRGGAFSLDGVHPSTRGYAIIANDFIDAINKTYNANIPKVDVTRYPALETAM
tara:strand:- start:2633 stop:4072 length:1440 start_codon:yes stop_codon:yes gene_type:complete